MSQTKGKNVPLEQQLRIAEEELENANNTNQVLLSTLSHDLRTPLNSIIGFADMIEQEIFGPIGNLQYREYLKYIYESGRSMLDIVDNVLDRERFEKMEQNEKDFRHIIALTPDMICICDDGIILLLNPAGSNMLGLDPKSPLTGREFMEFVHEDSIHLLEGGFDEMIKNKKRVEIKLLRDDDVFIDVEISALPYQAEDLSDNMNAVMLMGRDVSERNRTFRALAGREEHIKKIMDTIVDGIITIDQFGTIETINPAAEAIFGYNPNELIGQNVRVIATPDVAPHHDEYMKKYQETGVKHIVGTRREVMGRRKDGSEVSVELAVSEFRIGNRLVLIGAIRDITERKEQEEKLLFMATRDFLTKLPNRNLFHERLGNAIHEVDTLGGKIAVLFVDLDHFKNINDTLGHVVGDMIIQEAGVRISAAVREGDLVAHLAGDEFTIILENIKNENEVVVISRQILDNLAEVYHVDGKEVYSSGSLGVVLYPDHANDLNELLKNVDTAAHYAKTEGRNNYQLYTERLSSEARQRMQIETGLRRAIENDEFELYYQPKIDLNSRKIIGAEALLRWHSPELGPVRPDLFIPVAEETGLIIAIGEWVLETACRQASQWPTSDGVEIHVGVNLSALQFLHGDLSLQVNRILETTKLDPKRLDLELTESMLVVNPEKTIEILKEFSKMGASISMDDFGTGYSSLSYLTRFPLHSLKVDRAFVTNLPNDRDAMAIARAIVSMAQNLNLHIVAEGIETEGQVTFLHALGCHTGQGYLFSPPVPNKQIIKLIIENDFSTQP